MNVTLYGLKNCDTCRKALKEIEADGHNVTLIDVREDGMDPGLLAGLLAKHGDDVLLNKKSTTWRELSEGDKGQKAYTLLSKHPSLMKRPVLIIDEGVSFVGWSQEMRAELNKA
tara:strand:- start:9235 stop:9576 length:342 start_codon:yes stop_codon:yes gene_type:complete